MLKYGFAFVIVIFIYLTLTNCIGDNNSSENKMNLLAALPTSDTRNANVERRSKLNNKQYTDSIPEWYGRNRVQVLSSLLARDIGKPYFFDFPAELAKAGVTVLTREIKSGDEQPWWPSKYGSELPAAKSFTKNGANLAKDIIDQCHKLNIKLIVYYRHQEDSQMLANHPDWAVKDINSKNISTKRGVFLSLLSPYRDVLIERIKELSAYGADGFYFDEIHIPIKGDFSIYAQQRYKSIYGTDLLQDYRMGKITQFFEFRNNIIKSFFNDLRDTLATYNYHPMLIVSGNSWPSLTDLHMTSDFYKDFTLKSELEIPNRVFKNRAFTMPEVIKRTIPSFYINAFSFSFMRDNTFGPPNIWCPQIRSQDQAESIAAGLISLGCIAELDIYANPKRSNLNNFKTVLEWNMKYGKYFKDIQPYSVVGVAVSEKQRNEFIGNPVQAWNKAIMPSLSAFTHLYKNGIPVKLISDAQLNNPDNPLLLYANKSIALPTDFTSNKLTDLKTLSKNEGLSLAKELKSPIFCEKETEYSHVNYFKDTEGYIYVVSAPDFNSVKKDFTTKAKVNLSYVKATNYSRTTAIKLYIKVSNKSSIHLEDLVNNQVIEPVATENGYLMFNLKSNAQSLGLYRFKL